ncbi:MAG: hypothetical protein WA993_19385 [Candidatus Binatus sp.]|uniref:hypothetical protein n=1 Tax=Candidatus Binatus sp. TaxID=2811406 RepID=UPI003C86DFFF
MGKSLGISSNGLGFERFMKALVSVPKDEIDREIEKQKAERSARKTKKTATPHPAKSR